ncbi:MAG TPA: hypothetical protein VF821_11195, partial [Lentzea sp.]
MPDWTYHPLRRPVAAMLGVRRSQRVALRATAAVGSLPGGGWLIARMLGHQRPPAHLAGEVAGVPVHTRLGAAVPPSVVRDAVRALPLIGAGLIWVTPVSPADVPTIRAAAGNRRVPLIAATDDPCVAEALAGDVDAVTSP